MLALLIYMAIGSLLSVIICGAYVADEMKELDPGASTPKIPIISVLAIAMFWPIMIPVVISDYRKSRRWRKLKPS